jgi:hypothetical protein
LQFLAHCFDRRQNQFHKAGTFYPNSKLNHADITPLRCFNYSRNGWEVSDESVGVKITKWAGRKADVPSLPQLLKVQPGMPGPDGTIFIGMRMFVLRLTPNTTEYGEDWLLPNSCPTFELGEKELDCVCKSR